MKYNFFVNKNVNFVYWLKVIADKKGKYSKQEKGAYKIPLSRKELTTLERFNWFLGNPSFADAWIWDRYKDKPFKDKYEKEYWKELKNIFNYKFNIIWKEESHKLRNWKRILDNYDFTEIKKELNKIEHFLGYKIKNEIKVQLCLYHHPELAVGCSFPDEKEIILLNISSTKKRFINRVLGSLVHESGHLMLNNSKKELILKKSFEKILLPKITNQKDISWRNLITESIISSIAGADYSYLENKLFPPPEMKIPQKTGNINKMMQIAKKIKPLSTKYIEEGRPLDIKYSNKLMRLYSEIYLD